MSLAAATLEKPGSRPNHFATLLSAGVAFIRRDGKELNEIPVAVTGKWVKRGREFSITLDDLEAMARNFAKRKNEQVVIDYEHASETPEVALGGPVPAAGWIHALSVVHGAPRLASPSAKPAGDGGQAALHALIEWTPEARRMIHDGQYRFFSPAIDWNTRDKETGEPQGATLTSGALTNHPFLEELPPIMLTDLDGSAAIPGPKLSGASLAASSGKRTRAGETPALPAGDEPTVRKTLTVATRTQSAEGETPMKKLSLKPLIEGPAAGHHGVFDGDDVVGYVDADEFADYARQCLDDDADDANDVADGADAANDVANDCPSQQLAERLGVASTTTLDELRRRLVAGADVEAASARAVLLSEAAGDGRLDNAKAAVLARDGRITLADYIAAQEADRTLDEAVRVGKILPRDRKFFFRDALERPREFAEYVRHATPRFPLGSVGLASGGPIGIDDEVRARTESLMAEQNLSYSKALKKVFSSDRELATRYHTAHRRRLAGDAAGENAAQGVTA